MTASGEEDAAWAKVRTPLPPLALHALLADVERLFRLNPCLELREIRAVGAGVWRLAGHNESNGQPIDVQVTLTASRAGEFLALRYSNGIKRETRCVVEADGDGSLLTLTDCYETPAEADRERHLPEVDKSLLRWAAAIRNDARRQQRCRRWPGFRWLDRHWLAMTPGQRRVARLVVWTTIAEFVLFVALVAIYRAAA